MRQQPQLTARFQSKVGCKKTYLIRRKIHGKSILHTVGDCANFNNIKNAPEKDKVNLTCVVTLFILGSLGQMLGK
ncbi:MAG: hypothetical protein DID89_2727548560 [Candidatus Nitrotoga sp. CP45]|nr:MAG: hypothetical protein DID89_2727548560 [Candidatus Nitrotoga sp. CP45]